MKKEFKKTTLSNGLTVFLKEIHTAPLVSSWLWYRVGSKDETTGKTGISHWTEHMQFKGTPKFPARIKLSRVTAVFGTPLPTWIGQRTLRPCLPTRLTLPCVSKPTV
jgi:predicted Zn-dependent peptidase